MQPYADRLKGGVAIVTGGARGIGAAIVRRLHSEGARVAIADILADPARALAAELGERAQFVALDVTRESDWEAAVAAVRTAFGAPTAVVNNAGYLKAAAIEVATLDDWQRTMDVNAGGAFLGCRYGVREMREAGGSIVNVASTMGLRGIARHPAYCASKAAVRLLTRSVARHCGERRYPVRVNAVLPGAVETEMLLQNVAAGDDAAAFLDAIRAAHPIGRLGRPEDIAAAVAFLISGDAAFVTGTDLVVDGGGMA